MSDIDRIIVTYQSRTTKSDYKKFSKSPFRPYMMHRDGVGKE